MSDKINRAARAGIAEETVDEYLESLWLMEERGKEMRDNKSALCSVVVDEGLAPDCDEADKVIAAMAKDGHLNLSGEDVAFSDSGRGRAKNIIRRKRLAEKLLAEVFALGPSEIRSSACRFEHILSPEV